MIEQHGAGGAGDGCCWESEVVVEVAADLIVRVADAFGSDAARGEQEACGFYGTGGEDDGFGFKAEGCTGECADEDSYDSVARGSEEQLGGLRVEVDLCARVVKEIAADGVRHVAVREGRPLGEARIEERKLLEERGSGGGCSCEERSSGVGKIVDCEYLFGFRIEGSEIGGGDGP